MWKRILIASVIGLTTTLIIGRYEVVTTLANRIITQVTSQSVIAVQKPVKILEIQAKPQFSLVIEDEAKKLETDLAEVVIIRQSEQRLYLSENSAEVYQYTWEQFQAKQLSFMDFDAIILGERNQDLVLTPIQLEEITKFYTLKRPLIIQGEQNKQTNMMMTAQEIAEPTLEKLIQMIAEKPKNKPTVKVVGIPQSVIGGKAQNIQFHVITFDDDEDKLDLSVEISGSSNVITKQERKNLNSGAVEKFEFTQVQVQKNQPLIVSVEVKDQTGEQIKSEYTISTQASSIITETLTPFPYSEGYLLGDTLELLRSVTIDFGNQGKKICEIESQLKIDGSIFGETIGPITIEGVNPADINTYLKEKGLDKYTLELPKELNKEGIIIIESKVTLHIAKGNTCEKGKNDTTVGSGTSIVKIKKGKIITEFKDIETNELLTQPYELKLADETFVNEGGIIIHENMKSNLIPETFFDLNIPKIIPLKWSNHIKTEIINQDGSVVGDSGTTLNYSNSSVTIRYYFGPKNPIDGRITVGLDNNQFELSEATEFIATNQSFMTFGAKFTLQEKPDQIVIMNSSEKLKPILYYQTDLGYSAVPGIEWKYDSSKKQWIGTPSALWNELMPVIGWQPPTETNKQPCFLRWSVQMNEMISSTIISIEPIVSSDNQALINLKSYIEEDNLGSPILPDLF